MIFGYDVFSAPITSKALNTFMADVTDTGIYTWKTSSFRDEPNWATDTRTWEYGGYTITQEAKKQHTTTADADGQLGYKYQTTTIATDKDGNKIHEIVGEEIYYNNDDKKWSEIDPDRNADGNTMQSYLDDYDDDDDDDDDDDGEEEEDLNKKWMIWGGIAAAVLLALRL